jgi:HD-GYP domain-containing protein (c-di-GMP phosphodiesterase class II)
VAGSVALAQALAYARDLRTLYEAAQARERELEASHGRLAAAYQQALATAGDLRRTHRRLQRAIFQSLLGLANALEAKDPYTRGHSERVAGWARRVALALGLPGEGAETIAQAGLLHDLGKIGVPEPLLGKAGPLSPAEWEMMRRHPLIGAQILGPLEFFEAGAAIVRHHHERHDGSGYPDGLVGEAIPLGARIVAVADVYDAITSDRPYRSALPPEPARARLAQAAGHTLDARITACFLELLDAPAG